MWCCLAAGAAGCCALGVAAYVWQNPDSPVGQWAMSTGHPGEAHAGTADADPVIPPDPVPVEEPSDAPAVPVLPDSAAPLPPAVAALIPPIIIHDEEDLNASSGTGAKTEPPPAPKADVAVSRSRIYDFDGMGRRIDGDARIEPASGPPLMPRCADEAGTAPIMPRCIDDDSIPSMPPAEDGPVGRGMRRPAAWAWWLGFFSGPSHLMAAPSAVPGAEESSEPPAPKAVPHGDPLDLFDHPHHLQTPRPVEPESDTMEMRPSDWKPYSLDPGPF